MTVSHRSLVVCSVLAVVLAGIAVAPVSAGDWPQWRYGPGRGAAAPDNLPKQMKLLWRRQLPAPLPAWPASQFKLQFDTTYEPVAAGKLLFVPSNVSDRVTAYETDTGREVWRFYAEAPVRFAPVVHGEKVIFGSDDGRVYCVGAADGKERWRFRAAPRELRVVGNGRVTSAWPVRGAPVLIDGKVYFSASIWPFMGVFHYGLDAETGEVLWSNSGEGARWTVHPHGAPAFGSVAPQGYLAADAESLLIPGGRSMPGLFERKTGQLRYFDYEKYFGGGPVSFGGKFYFCFGVGFSLKDSRKVNGIPMTVVEGRTAYGLGTRLKTTLAARTLTTELRDVGTTDRKGKKRAVKKRFFVRKWDAELPGLTGVMIKAGSRIYGTYKGGVCGVDVPAEDGAAWAWSARLEGTPRTMLAADGKLLVVTEEGLIACFGAADGATVAHRLKVKPLAATAGPWKARVGGMVKSVGSEAGYAVVLGAASGAMIQELLAQSKLDLVVIEPDAAKASALRRRLDDAGLYGRRAQVLVGDPLDYPLAPYLAAAIVSESPKAVGLTPQKLAKASRLLNALRPYGGSLRLGPIGPGVAAAVAAGGIKGLTVETRNKHVVVHRRGPLPGSDTWTHQYGDEANQVVNAESLVKPPLGLLWFGGPPNDKILPRHGHGPSPQVAGGRLVIEGADILRCTDVYTGKVLWERSLPGIGKYYDNTAHHPGAGAIGSNYVTLPDAVYAVYQRTCLKLDPATGLTRKAFALPGEPHGRPPFWGYIGTHRDVLIAGVSPMVLPREKKGKAPAPVGGTGPAAPRASGAEGVDAGAQYAASSARLVVMDRHIGRVLWSRDAVYGFRHNAIAAGAGVVFCIDGLVRGQIAALKRRGFTPRTVPTLYALNARTGRVVWKSSEDVFGTWLGYAKSRGILIQGGSAYRDRAKDEVGTGIVAYQGRTGQVIWQDLKRKYGGPLMIHGDTLITNGSSGYALDLKTGKETGWKWRRHYGCNTAIACENIMTFRSGAAGFCDITGRSGTGNFGGFKSSCTSNLIPADGVLNAPDYTRTCTCAYQNQSSLALVAMPENEVWTFGPTRREGAFALNFGAPGNRRGPAGTLWMDWPSVGGEGTTTNVMVDGKSDSRPKGAGSSKPPKPQGYFPGVNIVRLHSTLMAGGDLKWVGASAVAGAKEIVVKLPAGTYTVRLVFAELGGAKAGGRVMNVSVQGKGVLADLDIAAAAGGPRRTVVKVFKDVTVDGELKIALSASKGTTIISGLEAVKQ